MRPARWTADEVRILEREWRVVSLRTLRDKLPNRTHQAIIQKAQALGLPFGQPQGTVGLYAAARLVGFSPDRLRRILAWADVTIKRWSKARKSHMAIDEFDVRDAVERWLAAETLEQAADRLHVNSFTLRDAMRSAGKLIGWKYGDRFEPAVFDAALRSARSTETIRAAAKRLGISHSTLNRALWAAGFPRSATGRGPRTKLLPGQAEEALKNYKAKAHKTKIES